MCRFRPPSLAPACRFFFWLAAFSAQLLQFFWPFLARARRLARRFFGSPAAFLGASLAYACRFLFWLAAFSARLVCCSVWAIVWVISGASLPVLLSARCSSGSSAEHLWPTITGSCCGSPLFRLVCGSFAASLAHVCRLFVGLAALSARLLQRLSHFWRKPVGSCFGSLFFLRLGSSAPALRRLWPMPAASSFFSPRFLLVYCRFCGVSGPCLPVLLAARRFIGSSATFSGASLAHACVPVVAFARHVFGSSAAALRRLWPTGAGSCFGSPFFRLVCCNFAASLAHACRFFFWLAAFPVHQLHFCIAGCLPVFAEAAAGCFGITAPRLPLFFGRAASL